MSHITLNDEKAVKITTKLVLRDARGRFKQIRYAHNLVTTVGKAHVADRLSASPGENAMSHMGIGSGTTAAAAGNTTLETELARVALDSRTDAANVVTYVATFPAGTGTGAVTECGIFNAASSGVLLARVVFSVITKGAADSLVLTHTLTLG